jgi:hypothetical protein
MTIISDAILAILQSHRQRPDLLLRKKTTNVKVDLPSAIFVG